jgi:hypothetical protein
MHRFRPYIVLACCAIVLFAAVAPNVSAFNTSPQSVTVPASPVAESPDFATRVLRDPWDMSEYADISQYMNESGQRLSVNNPQAQNGVFSGTSVSNAATAPSFNPYFFTLFPGYGPPSGSTDKVVVPDNAKIGYNYPINAGTYHCLYVAIKSDSPASVPGLGPDVMRVFWFANRYLNATGGEYGLTYLQLYPEAGAGQPTPRWQLLKIDLANPPNGVQAGVGWNSRSTWQGLRIDPTVIAANVQFQVDWVRLTSCGASNTTITWSSDAAVNSIWVRPVGTTRNIRIATGVNGASGSAQIDTQGLAAGSYLVGVGTATTCCSQLSAQPLVINQAPIATFNQPSFYSGADYATNAGNAWDFSDSADATVGHFASGGAPTSSYSNGELTVVTPPGPLPAGIDVYMNMDTPQPAATSEYRYLTVQMNTSWKEPWENIPDGMIARWIWAIQGTSGKAGFRCTIVGPDIPYDIGTQTYSIDLYDATNGGSEEAQGQCPAGTLTWQNSGSVLAMRFDPNENVTGVDDPISGGGAFTQKFDWIRLTKENQVDKGTPYLVQLALNKPSGDIPTQTFYYTTSRSQPTQHAAQAVNTTPPSGSNRVYIPLLANGDSFLPVAANPSSFVWDTSNVSPGTYYLCVELDDGVNSNTTCSDAPVTVQ